MTFTGTCARQRRMRRAYLTGSLWARVSAALLVACAAAQRAAAQGPSLPPFMELRVPKPPTVATTEKGPVLVYELHVTNFESRPVTLRKIDVRVAASDPHVLLSLADTMLARAIARPGLSLEGEERLELDPGTRAVVFFWIPVEVRELPSSLLHRVMLARGTGDSVRTTELDGPPVPVATESVVIGPPLRGGPWLAANGPADASGHRRALVPVGGVPAIAQRFAIDYVKVGDNEKTFSGDSLKNESYYAEGNDALAVANGTVVATKDGIPENVPGINSRAVPITLETVGGNHVIIDLGGGRYAFYAHLRPGSLRVKVGDRVTRGQVIGLVGNTGNSTEPHLHFHIADANSPLGSEGIPYRYDSFEIVAHCRMFNVGCERGTPVVRRAEIPLADVLIRFAP